MLLSRLQLSDEGKANVAENELISKRPITVTLEKSLLRPSMIATANNKIDGDTFSFI